MQIVGLLSLIGRRTIEVFVVKRSEDGQMQDARSAATEIYLVDKRGSEHRATQQMTTAVVLR